VGIIDFLKPRKGAPASQAAEMEASLAKLREERKSVETVVDSYGQRRADALLSDASDADIAKIDSDANLAQIRLERLELAELELVERIAAARDSDARQRRAGELEAAAAAIATKTAAVDAAASAFATAYKELLSAVRADLVDIQILSSRHTQPIKAAPADIAGAIAGQALAVACPQIFDDRPPTLRHWGAAVERVLAVHELDRDGNLSPVLVGEHGQDAIISTADHAARRIILEPLKRVAEEIRSGKVPADAKRPAPKPATIEPKMPEMRLVYVLKPLAYRNFRGDLETVEPGETHLPTPVYERALALDLAVERDDERAEAHRLASRRRRDSFDSRIHKDVLEPAVDTGVDVKRFLDAERARLNQQLLAAE
jgi:hypothetical protein